MDDLDFLIYMDGHHKFLFDETNLVMRLKEAGLGEVLLAQYDETIDPPERREQSLFVTAVKTSVDPEPLWVADNREVTWRVYADDSLPDRFYGTAYCDDTGTLDFVQRVLRPGMTVVDVGAHWGAFALFAGPRVAPDGVVHAFEPTEYSYRRLQENVQHSRDQSQQFVLNRAAVCDHDGECTVNVFPLHHTGWNTIGRPRMSLPSGEIIEPVSSEIVKAVTLDTYCRQQDIAHIDLLKIDVEGYEADVIRGGSQLLRESRIDTVIFEMSEAPLKGAGRSARDTLGAFVGHGLHISRIGERGELFPIHDIERFEAPFFANYVAERAIREGQQ
jgi:FkbM family methyltransferase